MTDDAERDWVRRAAGGDRAAFALLVRRYWRPVRAWIYGMCHEYHTAEDLTQEAFLRAWTGLPGLAEPTAFRVWLFRIARNALLARRRAPRPPAGPLPSDVPGPAAEPITALLEREGAAELRAAVDRLPAPLREAYLLWVEAAWPYAHIAQVLETTEETARWRVCEARKRLVRDLGPLVRRPDA